MIARRQTGHALIGTTVFVMLSSIMAATILTQVDGAIRTETASQTRMNYVGPSAYAMAWGLSLLETGQPPQTPYDCKAEVLPDIIYVLSFERTQADPLTYDLSVRPVTDDDEDLPDVPETFNADTDFDDYRRNRDEWRQWWQQWWQQWKSRRSRYHRRPWARQGDRPSRRVGWHKNWKWGGWDRDD